MRVKLSLEQDKAITAAKNLANQHKVIINGFATIANMYFDFGEDQLKLKDGKQDDANKLFFK